jgi:hypothetical protein
VWIVKYIAQRSTTKYDPVVFPLILPILFYTTHLQSFVFVPIQRGRELSSAHSVSILERKITRECMAIEKVWRVNEI